MVQPGGLEVVAKRPELFFNGAGLVCFGKIFAAAFDRPLGACALGDSNMSRSRIPRPTCLPLLLGLLLVVFFPPKASKNDISLEDSHESRFWDSPKDEGDVTGDRLVCGPPLVNPTRDDLGARTSENDSTDACFGDCWNCGDSSLVLVLLWAWVEEE